MPVYKLKKKKVLLRTKMRRKFETQLLYNKIHVTLNV